MANLGTLTIDLVAKTGSFIGPLDKAGRQAKKTSKDVNDSFSDSLKSVTKWGLGLGVVATGAAVAFAKKSIDAASAINDVAKAASVSTDTLQEMRHAASLSGISFDELDGSLQRFNKSIGEARAGSGSLYSYLKKTDQALLDQVRSANSTDDALNLIFKAMKNVANESDRAALAAAAFGRSGVKLSVLADDYETLRKEAQSLGLVIDSQLIKNADEAGDKLETLSRVIGAQLTTAVLNLSPTIQKVAEQILKLSESTAKFFGGGTVNKIDVEIAALEELRSEYKQTEETYSTLKKQKGSLFAGEADTLKEAQNNIETLTESIKQLNDARNGGSSKSSTPPTSLEKVQDTSWDDLKKVVEATSETNKQRLEIIRASNLAIKAENDRQLSEDIARDAAYRQLVEQADVAEIGNKYDGVEREVELAKYKYAKLIELAEEGSEERVQLKRLEKAELDSIEKQSLEIEKQSLMMRINSTGEALGMMADLAGEYAGKQKALYKTLFFASKAFALADAIVNWHSVVSKATASAPPPYNIPAIIAANIQGAVPVAGIVATTIAGMAHDGMDSIPETGTWLLKKGERVTTEKTSRKLDDTLSRLQSINSVPSRSDYAGRIKNNSGESHYHYHSHGPVFLDRAQMRDAAKMLMKESDRERTRMGAVN